LVGLFLLVCIGGSIGKTNITDRNVACNQQINAISPFNGVNGECLLYFMRSIFFYNQVLDKAGHGTLQIISKSKWEQLAFPLPPLNEQKRIVTKVDKLMKLCDELETKLTQTQTEREKIINAAVKQLLTV
jgi:type I restriction enzyme, S subunit